MHDRLAKFFERPDAARYLAARAALLNASRDAATFDLSDVFGDLEAGRFDAARRRLTTLPPIAAISPRVHYLAARAAEALGDRDDFALETFLFQACLKGLLATGDGTAARPYVVASTTDEHDVLESRRLHARRQSLVERVERVGRRYDVAVCEDDAKIWFDVTDLVGAREPVRSEPAAPARSRKPRTGRRVSASRAVE